MNTKDKLQKELREVRNEQDFNRLKKKLVREDMRLFTKKSGRCTFGFTTGKDSQKVHYLIDNGYSTGLCRWNNLYKYLEVQKI